MKQGQTTRSYSSPCNYIGNIGSSIPKPPKGVPPLPHLPKQNARLRKNRNLRGISSSENSDGDESRKSSTNLAKSVKEMLRQKQNKVISAKVTPKSFLSESGSGNFSPIDQAGDAPVAFLGSSFGMTSACK